MTERIPAILLMMGLAPVQAAAQDAFYERIPYRMNDPFVFCTQGQDRDIDPIPCWIPTPPYTGSFIKMPYCAPPLTWGKTWTNDDYRSLAYYLKVCPHGENPGKWGGPGQPDRVPFDH